jgi:four helix bundle protein
MAIERFEDIEAWQVARDLTCRIYEVAGQGPFNRDFGLRDQIQRAAVSAMANIAEGFDCQGNKAFIQFLGYALRSATEVQSHLYVALDQAYISQEAFDDLYQEAAKAKSIIHGFIRYLRNAERST